MWRIVNQRLGVERGQVFSSRMHTEGEGCITEEMFRICEQKEKRRETGQVVLCINVLGRGKIK